jgi:hypothetical protein
MKYLVKQPEKFRKKSEVPHCISPKAKSAKLNSCENDLYVEIEDHKDFFNQNPIVMIARIVNMFPVPVKMIEYKRKFICKVREIVFKNRGYSKKRKDVRIKYQLFVLFAGWSGF